ncbi:SGNH/GDSL hydrolase family protein [Amycolatopsis sp. NPDC051106]|uniref:SGNH/GDSL hydrolase family protein n=1 Tax=unclassified Amycolatopsis TaxID=2618356 RepID=UPI00343EA0B9
MTRESEDPDVFGRDREDALLQGARWRRIAFLGDSIVEAKSPDPVAGYERLSWPDRVVRALRRQQPDLVSLNLGVRDLTAAQVAETQLAPALAFGPDLAFVVCGGNDVMRRGFRPAGTRESLDGMVRALRAEGADVVLMATFDTGPLDVPEPLRTRIVTGMPVVRAVVREVAAADDRVTLVDIADHPRARDRGILSADGIHANHVGEAIIASAVLANLPVTH